MSKTGTYKWIPGRGLVKVSDKIPDTQVFDCYVPPGGYISNNADHKPIFFGSRTEKREFLSKHGLREQSELTKKEL